MQEQKLLNFSAVLNDHIFGQKRKPKIQSFTHFSEEYSNINSDNFHCAWGIPDPLGSTCQLQSLRLGLSIWGWFKVKFTH